MMTPTMSLAIATDDFRRKLAAIVQSRVGLDCSAYDMLIGEHMPTGRIDDEARTQALPCTLVRLLQRIEKAAKERILEKSIQLDRRARSGRYVDYCGPCFL